MRLKWSFTTKAAAAWPRHREPLLNPDKDRKYNYSIPKLHFESGTASEFVALSHQLPAQGHGNHGVMLKSAVSIPRPVSAPQEALLNKLRALDILISYHRM
jgi:hypothetical protein